MKFLKNLFNGLIFAGVIILFISLYYLFIRAGLPYQDPPLDIQIKYAVNMGIGEGLFKAGIITLIVGVILRVIAGMVGRRGTK